MTEATTSKVLAAVGLTLRGWSRLTIRCSVASPGCASAMYFSGVLRAQRFKHATSQRRRLSSLGFLCHLSAPIPTLNCSTVPPKCPQFDTGSLFSRRDRARWSVCGISFIVLACHGSPLELPDNVIGNCITLLLRQPSFQCAHNFARAHQCIGNPVFRRGYLTVAGLSQHSTIVSWECEKPCTAAKKNREQPNARGLTVVASTLGFLVGRLRGVGGWGCRSAEPL